MSITVTFHPYEKQVSVPSGTTILQAARKAGVPISSFCGGRGKCGKCKVKVAADNLPPLSEPEIKFLNLRERNKGYRLACQAVLTANASVQTTLVSEEADFKTSMVMELPDLELAPNVTKVPIHIPPPSLEDARPDLVRLLDVLSTRGYPLERVDIAVIRDLGLKLRKANWCITAVIAENALLYVEPGIKGIDSYGLALDVGTSTVAGYLFNLATGKMMGATASGNLQGQYGEDIMTRIDHAHAGFLNRLNEAVLVTVNDLIEKLCLKTGITHDAIYEAVVVGNSCMIHLLLGIDPHPVAVAPFVPVFHGPLDLHARELGMNISPGGNVHVLPVVAGFVGADTVADILTGGMDQSRDLRLMVDIGTNAEIVLSHRGRILACAAAAGPAFEGVRISCGMRAAAGAIDRVRISNGRVLGHVIETGPARGLAGSGLISAVATLKRNGYLTRRGRFRKGKMDPAWFSPQGDLVLSNFADSEDYKAITLSEKDIGQEFMLAKAAIQTGIDVLLGEMGGQREDISEILLSGAFGNYLDVEDAIETGIIPRISADRVRGIGNGAGAGAVACLLSKTMRARARRIAESTEYLELSAYPRFNALFGANLRLF